MIIIEYRIFNILIHFSYYLMEIINHSPEDNPRLSEIY